MTTRGSRERAARVLFPCGLIHVDEHIDLLAAEFDAVREQARAAALEEAARLIDAEAAHAQALASEKERGSSEARAVWESVARDERRLAAAIRALAAQPPKAT